MKSFALSVLFGVLCCVLQSFFFFRKKTCLVYTVYTGDKLTHVDREAFLLSSRGMWIRSNPPPRCRHVRGSPWMWPMLLQFASTNFRGTWISPKKSRGILIVCAWWCVQINLKVRDRTIFGTFPVDLEPELVASSFRWLRTMRWIVHLSNSVKAKRWFPIKGDESGKSWQEKNPRSTVRTNNRFWEPTANEPVDPKQWEYDRICNVRSKHRKQKSRCGSPGWMSLVCFAFKVAVGHYLFCWFNLVWFDRAGKIQSQDWHLVQSQVRIVIWNILSVTPVKGVSHSTS